MSEHMRDGRRALKTSLFKWSPDYLTASGCFERAAVSFRASRSFDECCEAHLEAASMHLTLDNTSSAAKNFEGAAEALKSKSISDIEGRLNDLEKAAEYFGKAAKLAAEGGEEGYAATSLSKKANVLVEAWENLPNGHKKKRPIEDSVIETYSASLDMYRASNKIAFSVDTTRAFLKFAIQVERWDVAIQVIDRMMENAKAMNQPLHKLRLSAVILNLRRNDLVAAQSAFRAGFDDDGYLQSDECAAAEDLTVAWQNSDYDKLDATIRKPVFNFLERQITMIARGLKLEEDDLK